MAEKNRLVALLIWSFVSLFYFYQMVLRVMPNMIMPYMVEKYGIGASEYGSFNGFYYIGYVIVHIPIGILLAHFGAKKVLPFCIILASFGLLPLLYSDNWLLTIFGRTVTGIGSSAAAVSSIQIFRSLYPTKFSMMIGLMVSFGLLATDRIGKPLAYLMDSIGTHGVLNILMISGLIIAFVTYVLLPKDLSDTSHNDITSDLTNVFGNYKVVLASIFAGLMIGPMEGFADAWAGPFLVKMYALDVNSANGTALSIIRGMAIGCIVLPYIADKTRLYFGVTIFSGLAMCASFVYIIPGTANINWLEYISFIIGFFSAYQVVIIPKISTFVSEERSGIAGAVANMIIMAFGFVFHKSIGYGLDYKWDGTMVDGVKVYNQDAFIFSMSFIPLTLIIASIGLLIISISIIIKAKRIDRQII